MEERIKARIAEIKVAEQEAIANLFAIRTARAELEALLKPAEPTVSGAQLGEQSA